VSTGAERRNRPIERWPMRRFELAKPVTLEVIDGEPPRFLAARRTRAVRREVTPARQPGRGRSDRLGQGRSMDHPLNTV
jgi:hypothetical protein